MTVARRPLKFDSLDAVVRDAENLLASGYDRAGNWDLAQVCGHLAEWLRFPMDGFPKVPLLIRQAVFGNIGTLISFRVGHTDAEALRQEFGNIHAARDIWRLLLDGDERAPSARSDAGGWETDYRL